MSHRGGGAVSLAVPVDNNRSEVRMLVYIKRTALRGPDPELSTLVVLDVHRRFPFRETLREDICTSDFAEFTTSLASVSTSKRCPRKQTGPGVSHPQRH